MSMSVDIRAVDELFEDEDDLLRAFVVNAYGGQPIEGSEGRETLFPFSYQALPPDKINNVLGDLANGDPIGLLVQELPFVDPDDVFGADFFSLPKSTRALEARYPEIANRSLDEVYEGYESGKFDDEQVLVAVLIDFVRHPLPGFPVVVFRW